MVILPDGAEDKSDEDLSPEEWVRSRPPGVQALLRRFPPGCIVRALRPLVCPASGTNGWVVSWFEDGKTITVVQLLEGNPFAVEELKRRLYPPWNMRAECQANWLEPVRYWGICTPEWVAKILDGK